MNVLLINDSTSNANWGDRAGAIALKKMVADSGGNIFAAISEDDLRYSSFQKKVNGEQQTIQRNPLREVLKLFVPPVMLKVRDRLIARTDNSSGSGIIPERMENFDSAMQLLLKKRHLFSSLLDAVELSDLAVINGDGCMTGNGIIPRTELFLSYLLKKHFDKPVIIVNHTADFEHPDLLEMARTVYPLFDDVVFRDSLSLPRCREFCDGRVAPDAAFLFEPIALDKWLPVAQRFTYFDVWPDMAQFDPGKPYICIGGSSIYFYKKSFDPIDGFSRLINHIKSIYPHQIVLTVSDGQDQRIFRPVAKQFNLPLIGVTTPVQQAVDIIGNADAYIGGRWHPSIFALRGGVPIIPISSITFKMQALAEMSGLSSSTFDALNLDQDKQAIGKQLVSYLEQGKGLRSKLRQWAQQESLKSWDNVMYLRKQ